MLDKRKGTFIVSCADQATSKMPNSSFQSCSLQMNDFIIVAIFDSITVHGKNPQYSQAPVCGLSAIHLSLKQFHSPPF